jgi:hypothetical protein
MLQYDSPVCGVEQIPSLLWEITEHVWFLIVTALKHKNGVIVQRSQGAMSASGFLVHSMFASFKPGNFTPIEPLMT